MGMSTSSFAATTSDWTIAAAMLAGSVAIAFAIRQFVHVLTRRMRFQGYVTTIISRFVGTIVVLLGLAYALRQLEVEVGPLLGALGLGGLVVALSLQHVLGNLIGSILLHARRPVRRGDQIHTNDHSGTVIDINGRAVVMMTFEGERVHIPNLRVLDEPIRNQTAEPYRRTTIPVQVSYEADLRQVQRMLTESIRKIEGLDDAPPADVIVTSFDDSGVTMTARVWHPSEELTARWLVSEAHIAIREALSLASVEIPFPQRVVHLAGDRDRLDRSTSVNGAIDE